jgi:hypothetical protein
MRIIPRKSFKPKVRLLSGRLLAPGWQITPDRGIYFCELCNEFHLSVGHATESVRGSCPQLAEGAPLAIMMRGAAPVAILWAMHNGVLGPIAARLLDEALRDLDRMFRTPKTERIQ